MTSSIRQLALVFMLVHLFVLFEIYGPNLIPNSNNAFNINTFELVIPDLDFNGCQCDKMEESQAIEGIWINQTTCGPKAFKRGSHQNVVSFVFYDVSNSWGNRYLDGLIRNLRLMPKIYPGWQMRIYIDLDRDHTMTRTLCKFSCEDKVFNAILDICPIRNLNFSSVIGHSDPKTLFPMLWRFLPALDHQVTNACFEEIDYSRTFL